MLLVILASGVGSTTKADLNDNINSGTLNSSASTAKKHVSYLTTQVWQILITEKHQQLIYAVHPTVVVLKTEYGGVAELGRPTSAASRVNL